MDNVTITYGDLPNPVYRPGDTVIGRVSFLVRGEISIKSVKLICYGAALTKWRTSSPRQAGSDGRSNQLFIRKQHNFVDGKDIPKLTEGRHTFTFRFELPNDNLPSSFEGELGAVRYWLKFHVDKAFPGVSYSQFSPFTVLANVNGNDFQTEVSRKDSKTISKSGTLQLFASVERGAYCPGEKMLISLEAINNSTKDIGVLKVRLVQHSWFIVSREEETRTIVVNAIVTPEKLRQNDRIKWTRRPFEVPATPPSTANRSCKIIDVSYFLEVEIEAPKGKGSILSIKLPVTIATVPLGAERIVSTKYHEDHNNYSRVELTKPMKYVTCTDGVRMCSKKDPDLPFPQISFTPSTAYVMGSIASAAPNQTTRANSDNTDQSTSAAAPPPQAACAPPPVAAVAAVAAVAGSMNNAPHAEPSAPPLHLERTPSLRSLPPLNTGAYQPQSAHGGSVMSLHTPALPSNETPPSYDSIYTPTNTPTNVYAPAPVFTPAQAPPIVRKSSTIYVQNTPNLTWNGTTIGAIFPICFLREMKEFLKDDTMIFEAQEGRLLGIFDEFQIEPLVHTAAIFAIFKSEPQASEWAQHLISSNTMLHMQVFLSVNDSPFSSDVKNLSLYPFVAVTLDYKDPTKTTSFELIQTSTTLSRKVIPPLRTEFGGKELLVSAKVRLLAGNWADRPYSPEYVIVSISLWPSKGLYDAYNKELNKSSEYKIYNEIYKISHTSLLQAQSTWAD